MPNNKQEDRDSMTTPPTVADCRWCNKKIVFVWGKWQHMTRAEQQECPSPFPFEEQLPAPAPQVPSHACTMTSVDSCSDESACTFPGCCNRSGAAEGWKPYPLNPAPAPPCEYCGPVCYHGAEHNERVENGDKYVAPQARFASVGMPHSSPAPELQALDVTQADHQKALDHITNETTEWYWNSLHPDFQAGVIGIIAVRYCRERQLLEALRSIAQLRETTVQLLETITHFEKAPFFTRDLFENDGQMVDKDFSAVSETDFKDLFEYSAECKCQGCAEIRYILQLRAQVEELQQKIDRMITANEWLMQDRTKVIADLQQQLAAKDQRIAELTQDAVNPSAHYGN